MFLINNSLSTSLIVENEVKSEKKLRENLLSIYK